jgi:hypothetical protein
MVYTCTVKAKNLAVSRPCQTCHCSQGWLVWQVWQLIEAIGQSELCVAITQALPYIAARLSDALDRLLVSGSSSPSLLTLVDLLAQKLAGRYFLR